MTETQNFNATLQELEEFLTLPIQNDRDVAGIIQAFEFTFEQSWKSIQKIAFTQGTTLGNPKASFMYAIENGWINSKEEDLQILVLKDRNLTTHTYVKDFAQEVLGRIQNSYLGMFQRLLKALEGT